MLEELDAALLREITDVVFPPPLHKDAHGALHIVNRQYGSWSGSTKLLNGLAVQHYSPSELAVRVKDGSIIGAWVPLSTPPAVIEGWAAAVAESQLYGDPTRFHRIVMCTAPVVHRWDLKDAGIILYPVPADAPQPPPGFGQYPALLSAMFSPRKDIWLRSRDASPAFEWCYLLLNALTPIGCHSPAFGQHGWTWERRTDVPSKWSELIYSIPALYEHDALEAALAAAPIGSTIDDHAYYVGQYGAVDNALVLPRCLDETIVAANALPEGEREVLRRAARWIKAGERAGDESRSLNYLALVCGLEALSQSGWKGTRAKKGFSQMMHDLLPCYGEVESSAAYLYKLRCSLSHDAAVFADDWEEVSMESDRRDMSALYRLTWLCRLVVTNWVRSKRGLPLVGSRQLTD